MRLVLLLLPLALSAQDSLPSAEALIRAAVAADKAEVAKGSKFTWREDQEQHPVDKNGKPQMPTFKTFDVIMLEGENYRKLILTDGHPPDAKLQKQIDADLEKERAARRSWQGLFHSSISIGGVDSLERLFDNKVVGEETLSGRPAWRVDSTPKAGPKPATKEDRETAASRRTTWFDREEGVALKERNTMLVSMNGQQPGTVFEIEWSKHGEACLPDRLAYRYDAKLGGGLIHLRGNSSNRYYDYKKFDVETKITIQ